MILWSERFATGSATIDQQHQMLINSINQLEGMLTSTSPTPEQCRRLIELIDFLDSYAGMHFKFEEQCMESHRCPAHQQNQAEHAQFRESIHRFKARQSAEGFRPEVLKELYQMSSSWVERHILQVDIQLKPCLKS